MAVKYTRPRGTQDVLPQDSWKWQYVEDCIRKVARTYGYSEIRVPTFESTEVFARGVGEGTDIVSKEMYTFEDKGGRSVTLRPEGTAGVTRAVLENGLLASSPLPLKTYYIQSCFRYEKAQKGRYREFHQFGVECFGTHAAISDVEIMMIVYDVFRKLDITDAISLQINSIGCPKCRPAYNAKLTEYLQEHKEELCPTCQERLTKNPMRILDCKEDKCQKIIANAPLMQDYLCEDCVEHFDEVKAFLTEANIAFTVNPRLVRGLDYYTNTVFEFIANGIGTKGTVCGGGRYDGLIEQFDGQHTPAVGFGMGLERLLMLLEELDKLPTQAPAPALYAVGQSENGRKVVRELTAKLRACDIWVEMDTSERSIKAQMKAANRLNAKYVIVLGDDEIESKTATLKNMADKTEYVVSLPNAADEIITFLQKN